MKSKMYQMMMAFAMLGSSMTNFPDDDYGDGHKLTREEIKEIERVRKKH